MGIDLQGQLHDMTSKLERSFDLTLEVLVNAMYLKDSSVGRHLKRVSASSILISRSMGLDLATIKLVGRSALLHDIGKLGVPEQILSTPGPLEREEVEIMRTHCVKGQELVKRIPYLADAAEIIYSHHENFDGSGYPRGLRGEEIPLAARILALSNTVDSITTTQPYREAKTFSVALAEIERCAGGQFDPDIAGVVLKIPQNTWSNLTQSLGLGSS